MDRKPRELWVEFGGDPSDDKENYKRYCGAEKFSPVSPAEEVIHFIEKSAYDKAIKALKERHDITDHEIEMTLKELGEM